MAHGGSWKTKRIGAGFLQTPMSEHMSDRMPERMSDYMSDRLPDGMSEYMSDRLPERIS
jgi:hypothetical protein